MEREFHSVSTRVSLEKWFNEKYPSTLSKNFEGRDLVAISSEDASRQGFRKDHILEKPSSVSNYSSASLNPNLDDDGYLLNPNYVNPSLAGK